MILQLEQVNNLIKTFQAMNATFSNRLILSYMLLLVNTAARGFKLFSPMVYKDETNLTNQPF